VLVQPVDGFVRGYQLNQKLLVLALNTADQPKVLSIQSDFTLWLPGAKIYTITKYDTDGKIIEATSTHQARPTVVTKTLNPGELEMFEIQAK
jgi:hypothetical protein